MPTMLEPAAGGGAAGGNVLDIGGNVDPASGHVDHAGDVAIAGNVADLMRVRAGGSVRVGGVVQEATVQAGGSLSAAIGNRLLKDQKRLSPPSASGRPNCCSSPTNWNS